MNKKNIQDFVYFKMCAYVRIHVMAEADKLIEFARANIILERKQIKFRTDIW